MSLGHYRDLPRQRQGHPAELTYTTPDLLSLNGIACLGNINIYNHEHHPIRTAKEYNGTTSITHSA